MILNMAGKYYLSSLFVYLLTLILTQALLSVFYLITLDSWDYNMKYMMVLCGPVLVAIFTITALIIGVFIMLNLFLAVLLGNLDCLEEEEEDMEELLYEQKKEAELVQGGQATISKEEMLR